MGWDGGISMSQQREPHIIRVSSTQVRDRPQAAPLIVPGSKRTQPGVRTRFTPKQSEVFKLGERLLRDCALCVAVVLCVLAVGNIRQPWAQSVSSTVRDAVTMDLDESLGRLQFVRNLLPESALVFWNVEDDRGSYLPPATGRVVHAWMQGEPWIEYECEAQSVIAAAAGEVMAITQGEGAAYMVRVRHEDGAETLYGDLVTCIVREGDALEAGQILGAVQDRFFFEARRDGRSFNPTDRLRGQ